MNRGVLCVLACVGLGVVAPGPWLAAQTRRPAGRVVELGGLRSTAPADWSEEEPGQPDCVKRYRLEPVGNDREYTRLVVFSLDKGVSAAEQVKRWKAMFLPPEGRRPEDAVKERKLTVAGRTATYLDVRGVYRGIPGEPTSVRQDFRLLGVYLDTPKGPYAIRLLGPSATVSFYQKEFDDWVKGFREPPAPRQ
jgi:hypothetical protein